MTIVPNAAGGNWSAGGTWVGGAPPGLTDPVDLSTLTGTLTIDGTSGSPNQCLDLLGGTSIGTLAHASSKFISIAGNLDLTSTSLTYAPSASSTMTFTATATGKTVKTAGKTMGNTTFNGAGGGWSLSDNFVQSTSSTFTVTKGSFVTNAQGLTVGSLTSSGINTRSFDYSGTVIQVSGNINFNTVATGLTVVYDGSSGMVQNGNGRTFAGGDSSFAYYTDSGNSGTRNINGSPTFTAFTIVGNAATANVLQLSDNMTVSGLLTITGNSRLNQLFVQTSTNGTTYTLSAGSLAVTNADFNDITAGGAASWDFSAQTDIGDCTRNTGITFPAPITCYLKTAVSVNYSASNWYTTSGGSTPARVPLCQDTARIDSASVTAASKVITFDLLRIGAVNMTGVLNTPTITQTVASSVFGSITYAAAITPSGTGTMTLSGGNSNTLTTNTVVLGRAVIIDAKNGTWGFGDNVDLGTIRVFSVNAGTFNTNNHDLSCNSYTLSNPCETNLGSSSITVTGTGTVVAYSVTPSGSAGTSKFIVSNTSATAKTVQVSGTVYDVEVLGASGNGIVTFSTVFTGNSVILHPYCSIKFTSGNTYTLTVPPAWVGASGQNIVVTATSTTAATIASTGTAICDYLTLSKSTITGTTTAYAGSHSTNSGTNTGWTFSDPPSGVTGTVSVTEVGDSMAATGTMTISGSMSSIEAYDAMEATGSLIFTGSMAATEAIDSMAASGSETFIGSMTANEGQDSMVASAFLQISGSALMDESTDTMAASGELIISGSMAASESRDSMASAGEIDIIGHVSATERHDSFSASGKLIITGSMAATESSDTMAANAVMIFSGEMVTHESHDSMEAIGETNYSISGSMAANERADNFTSAGYISPVGSMSALEGHDVSYVMGRIGASHIVLNRVKVVFGGDRKRVVFGNHKKRVVFNQNRLKILVGSTGG